MMLGNAAWVNIDNSIFRSVEGRDLCVMLLTDRQILGWYKDKSGLTKPRLGYRWRLQGNFRE